MQNGYNNAQYEILSESSGQEQGRSLSKQNSSPIQVPLPNPVAKRIKKEKVFENLKNKSTIEELNLNDYSLTSLPEDLSEFKELKTLHLNGNNFQDYNSVALSLGTLPKFQNLFIDLKNDLDVRVLLDNLPNLEFLNGKSTTQEGEGEESLDKRSSDVPQTKNEKRVIDIPTLEEHSLQFEIPHFDSILNKAISYYKNSKEKKDKFNSEFSAFLKTQIDFVNSYIDLRVPNYVYISAVNHAKLRAYSWLKKKILSILNLQKLISNHVTLFNALSEIEKYTTAIEKDNLELVQKLSQQIEDNISYFNQANTDNKATINTLEDKVTQLKEENDKKGVIINSLKAKISSLEGEKAVISDAYEKLKADSDEMTQKMLSQAKSIIKKEKQRTEYIAGDPQPLTEGNFNINGIKKRLLVGDLNKMVQPFSSRTLSKKQLKEIINEIYKSKEATDKKNYSLKLPKETLEQHMYNYLNHKYGLKNLIVEWATAILNAVKTYARDDAEICLFAMILRNEIEENTLIVISTIKSRLRDLIKLIIGERFPNKVVDEVNLEASKIINGREYMEENLWKGISALLFRDNKKLLNKFVNKVQGFIEERINFDAVEKIDTLDDKLLRKEQREAISEAINEKKILFSDFEELLMRFQILVRAKYLTKFVAIFRSVDADLNGVLNDFQFRELLNKIGIFDEENLDKVYDKLIGNVDPFLTNDITFSDIVFLFENEFLEDGDSLMKKIIEAEIAEG